MKTIGLIGGMSWESSSVYYQLINRKANELLGGYHSCRCIMYSVDFAEIEEFQHQEKWNELDSFMIDAAKRLELGGADIILLCTNSMHVCSQAIIGNINIPFLHIADAAGEEIINNRIHKVGLLGTRFTMEMDFYKEILSGKYGIEVIIPDKQGREFVHKVIYGELVHGEFNDTSREQFIAIINQLKMTGAEGIVLGCTEIPLLISETDVDIPLFNTTKIHAEKAVGWAVNNDQ